MCACCTSPTRPLLPVFHSWPEIFTTTCACIEGQCASETLIHSLHSPLSLSPWFKTLGFPPRFYRHPWNTATVYSVYFSSSSLNLRLHFVDIR